MKAATGELQLTVITIIAIALILGFFYLMWDKIKEKINTEWTSIETGKGKTPFVVNNYEFIIHK